MHVCTSSAMWVIISSNVREGSTQRTVVGVRRHLVFRIPYHECITWVLVAATRACPAKTLAGFRHLSCSCHEKCQNAPDAQTSDDKVRESERTDHTYHSRYNSCSQTPVWTPISGKHNAAFRCLPSLRSTIHTASRGTPWHTANFFPLPVRKYTLESKPSTTSSAIPA